MFPARAFIARVSWFRPPSSPGRNLRTTGQRRGTDRLTFVAPSGSVAIRRPWKRAVPFGLVSAFSILLAAHAPDGRKPWAFDVDLSRAALADSMPNHPHVAASAFVLCLAALAVGWRRLPWAVVMTVLVGLGWELGQTTVVGHHARLRDLIPDLVGALLAAGILAIIAGLRMVWSRAGRGQTVSGTDRAGPPSEG